ncbi:MAG: glycosyltransferase, partial [Minisyncoccia bacterium]
MFYLEIIVGILFCSFWLSQLIFVKHHLNWSNKIEESDERDEKIPVSIIHPIKDVDFELEKNLESLFSQNYKGKVQHIFSFQDPSDPAIPIVQDFIKKFDYIDSIITINPLIAGLNGKSSNMVHGIKLAKYDTLLFIDSDLRVNKDFILKMVRPLSNKKVGLTTCGQMNIGGKDFWTRFFTFLQNSETDFMWAFFTKLNLNVGATGAAFAINKNLLENIGGLERFGGSLLEDLHLGETLYKKGYKLILGPFLMSYVDKLPKEKSFNYAKRLGVGIKSHIA